MIAPIEGYPITGAIWYQGESNAGEAPAYHSLFSAMIQDWRTRWGQGDFPFLFVQLAAYMQKRDEPGESNWAALREAQLETLDLPATGMAVTIDIGDAEDIHPRNKHDVGKRLGLAARKIAYDQDLIHSGPIHRDYEVAGHEMVLFFDHVGSGLTVPAGQPLSGFTIAGMDREFQWAEARIEEDRVIVWSDRVYNPVAVRYAWADNPTSNLYNREGLPASPFRTDDWK